MALFKLLEPHRNMTLCSSEHEQDEPYSPGLKICQGESPDKAILLNATYNNYRITNNYKSTEHLELNDKLKKENKELRCVYSEVKRKYEKTKKVLRILGPLISKMSLGGMNKEERENAVQLLDKWEQHKRKAEEQTEDVCKKRRF